MSPHQPHLQPGRRGSGLILSPSALQSDRELMANSKYEYVKEFEIDDRLLPNVYVLVRIDGKGFHKFSAAHEFHKPNDIRALNLMNHAARCVMHELEDILIAFGESDEYSFLFRRSTDLYQRRSAKIVSTVVSLFTSAYVYYWGDYFTDSKRPLYPPVFDGRAVLYPTEVEVKDYFAWRQADTHINNLFNTSFWALVEKGGLSPKAAEVRLSGTDSKEKNEMLFTEFNTNYSKLPAIFRKGSVLLREHLPKDLPRDFIIPTPSEMLSGSTAAAATPSSTFAVTLGAAGSSIKPTHGDNTDESTFALPMSSDVDGVVNAGAEEQCGKKRSLRDAEEVVQMDVEDNEDGDNIVGTATDIQSLPKTNIDNGMDMDKTVSESASAELLTATNTGEGEEQKGKVPPVFVRMKKGVVIDHIDIIGEKFWSGRGAYILMPEKKKRLRTK
ncbi:hypothetical protein BGW38_001650 [Lunasporangiospora selenospora]|uniref:tRNA(His) guanylyltransferase n=1 Tax=Lunasporangiospora selenospora TaxID=979761 RepID=A0A9P6KDD9_9FUNG|nr:hypothetical protein BGW38_001650 [Lunasporangiospora selenospora]